MKLFHLTVILFVSAFIVSCVHAQSGITKVSSETKTCKSNKTVFTCPKDKNLRFIELNNGVLLAAHSQNIYGVFVLSSGNGEKQEDLVDTSLRVVLKNLYETDLEDYRWKISDDNNKNNSWSKYQVGSFSKQGLNKKYKHQIDLKIARLLFEKKDIIVGYVSESTKGDLAEEVFNISSGGSNYSAGESMLEIISSITGEKSKEVNSSPDALPPMPKRGE